ncbi:MAG: hypothetical protein IKJ09_03240 [Bacteroidaceae bacterium]|nr:hypothetical protein [Bacteroidaceae bacterium]
MATKNCESSSIYNSLVFCTGETVLPGVRKHVYCIPKAQIVSWPSLPKRSEVQAMKDLVIYQGSFELAADATWLRLDLSLNKGAINYETQGEKPSRTILNKGSFKHPYNDEDAAAFASQAIADDLVFAVQQRNGKWRILGNEKFETDVKVSGGSGEGTTGDVGTTIEVEVTDEYAAPFYRGTLVTEDGEIDCSGEKSE